MVSRYECIVQFQQRALGGDWLSQIGALLKERARAPREFFYKRDFRSNTEKGSLVGFSRLVQGKFGGRRDEGWAAARLARCRGQVKRNRTGAHKERTRMKEGHRRLLRFQVCRQDLLREALAWAEQDGEAWDAVAKCEVSNDLWDAARRYRIEVMGMKEDANG